MGDIKFADNWIQTTDQWCRKQTLYQLSHNHSNIYSFFACATISKIDLFKGYNLLSFMLK